MIVFQVTPPAKEDGAEVDGAEDMGGASVYIWGRHGLSCAFLHRTVVASMAPITEKQGEKGKGIEKWWRIRVIAKQKMSLLQVVISL